MPLWKLFYHAVWSTKNRLPLLIPEFEPEIHDLLREKAEELEAKVLALNGTEDHVHLVAAIPPKIAVAKFIGQLKGSASARFNKSGKGSLYWQEEYGVFSLDEKRLPICIAYVERQKEHHSQNSTIGVFENMNPSPEINLRARVRTGIEKR